MKKGEREGERESYSPKLKTPNHRVEPSATSSAAARHSSCIIKAMYLADMGMQSKT